jgi:L-amino acid N-acyltransferase YncA
VGTILNETGVSIGCQDRVLAFQCAVMAADIWALSRRIRCFFIERQKLFVVVRDISPANSEIASSQPDAPAIQCSVLTDVEALAALEGEFSGFSRDSIADLKQRIEQGCILFMFRKLDPAARKSRIVAYSISQRGVFSAFGTVRKISNDILFGHYFEILSEYRGRGLKPHLDGKREHYCRLHGLTKICGVVAPHNIASLKANVKSGFRVVGNVTRITILKRFVFWQTAWKTIEKALSTTA